MLEIINEFLEKKIDVYEKFASEIEPSEKPRTILLDELFKETIFEVWK